MSYPSQDSVALFLEAILENASGPIVIKDLQGRFLLANRQFAAIHGRETHEIIGMQVGDLYPPERARFFLDKDRQLLADGGPRQNEVQAITVDGERRDLLTQRFPVRDRDGGIFAVGTVNTDITKLKRAEAELERYRDHLDREIAERTAELQALNAQKDRLFSIIAHDLREPFNRLLGYSEMLTENVERMSATAVSESARTVHDSGQQVFKLLENLLLWSRLQMNKVDIDPAPVPVADALSRAIALIRPRADEKGISIETRVEGNPVANVDPGTVDSVLRNLLSNAVKFTSRGGTVIATTEAGSEVSISIRDTGCGIPDELAAQLFRIDHPASRPGTEGEMGTGLGLALCQELVARQNGRLEVESIEGQGTTARVTLPATCAE